MKKLLFVILVLALFSCVGFSACGGSGENGGGPVNPVPGQTLQLSDETLYMHISDEKYLTVVYSGTGEVQWTSSNADVVSVSDNGKVTALKKGEATVTAKIGDIKGECVVTVTGYDATKLSIDFEQINLMLYKTTDNETVAINGTLKYKGKALNVNYTKSFSSNNEGVATVDANGNVSAVDYGSAMITVTYTIDGIEVQGTVTVRVISSGSISIGQDSVTVYTRPTFGGNNFINTATLTATAFERGVEVPNATIVWSAEAGQDVVSLNGNQLTAQNAGQTEITATYTDANNQPHSDTITVTVLPVSADLNLSAVAIAKNENTDGYAIDLEALTGEAGTVNSVRVKSGLYDVPLSFSDGKADISTLSAGAKIMYLETRNEIYGVPIEIWTASVSDAAELAAIKTQVNGWYYLKNDIDLGGSAFDYANSLDFVGVLDGKGYKIYNAAFNTNGLFTVLDDGAIIRDIDIQGKIIENANGIGLVANEVKEGATVQLNNVNIYADLVGQSSGGLFGNLMGTATLTNVSGVVSRKYENLSNGAVCGIASGNVSDDSANVKIYSLNDACGNGTDGNTGRAKMNGQGIVIKPTTQEKSVYDVEQATNLQVAFSSSTYASQSIYGNTVRTLNTTSGNVTFNVADVEGRFGGSVDVLLKKGDGSVDYYALKLKAVVYLDNNNFAKYMRNPSFAGTYEMIGDVDLSTVTNPIINGTPYPVDGKTTGVWAMNPSYTDDKVYSVFRGTLDGKGHTITNLNIITSTGLFYSVEDATIKNIKIIDANINSQAGVIAYSVTGTSGQVVIDNVYVSVKSSKGVGYSGLINRSFSSTAYKVKNSVVYMPTLTFNPDTVNASGEYDTDTGFVRGYYNANPVEIENSVFIGGNGKYIGKQQANDPVLTVTNSYVYSALEAHKQSWGAAASYKSVYTDNHKYVALTQSNFVDKIRNASNEILELTQDVDLANILIDQTKPQETGLWKAGGYQDGSVNGGKDFSGVLFGENHKITNLKISWRGLFNSINCGAILDLLLVDAVVAHGQAGVLAHIVAQNASFSVNNVYISVKEAYADSSYAEAGVVFKSAGGFIGVSNSVIYIYGQNLVNNGYGQIGFIKGNYWEPRIRLNNTICISDEAKIQYIGCKPADGSTAGSVTILTTDTVTGIYTTSQINANALATMSSSVQTACLANMPS